MKILADYHHSDLFESYQLLGDRFGWEFYAPYGMQWYDDWYWSFERAFHGDAVARQYLDGVWVGVEEKGDHYERPDGTHPGRIIRGVTVEQALSQRWDAVISSVPENDAGLHGFAQKVGAKFGVQMGNQAQLSDWDRADFGLVSTNVYGTPPKPHVIYHQEFSLDDFSWVWPPEEKDSVASFIQCFAENAVPYAEFLELARAAPDLTWKVYGAYGTHPVDEFACGNQETTPKVAQAIQRTRIAWHSKSWSDGYGHVVHNLFAVGRPVFGRAAYYADKLAGPLWVEGVTSFDVDCYTQEELLRLLRRLRDDDEFHYQVSLAANLRFREIVDFEADAEAVRRLMESVLG